MNCFDQGLEAILLDFSKSGNRNTVRLSDDVGGGGGSRSGNLLWAVDQDRMFAFFFAQTSMRLQAAISSPIDNTASKPSISELSRELVMFSQCQVNQEHSPMASLAPSRGTIIPSVVSVFPGINFGFSECVPPHSALVLPGLRQLDEIFHLGLQLRNINTAFGNSIPKSWLNQSDGTVPRPMLTKPEIIRKKRRDKKLPCPHCPKFFRSNHDRQTHVRSHTGERPFACGFPGCSKAFAQVSDRTRHFRVHSGSLKDLFLDRVDSIL